MTSAAVREIGAYQCRLQTYLVIIEPRQFISDCLVHCLSMVSGDYVVTAYATFKQWEQSAEAGSGDNVLLRYAPSKRSRKELAEEMAALARSGRVTNMILISDDDDPDEIVDAINGGAKGYIPTNVSLKVAIEAMRLVKAGGVYVPASSLLSRRAFGTEPDGRDRPAMFTPRQFAVLEEIRKGKANKIIAYDLKMKESTVKVHVRNIMRKVGATNRTEVAVRAIELSREGHC